MIYPLQLPFSLIIVAPTKVPNTTLTNVQLSEDMNKRRMFVAFCQKLSIESSTLKISVQKTQKIKPMLYSIINNCSLAVVFHTITFHLILKNKNHLKKHNIELTEYQTKFIRIASLWMGSLKRFHSVTQKLRE